MHAQRKPLNKKGTGLQSHVSEAPNGAVQHTCSNALAFPQTLEGLLATPRKKLPTQLNACLLIQWWEAVFVQCACWDRG